MSIRRYGALGVQLLIGVGVVAILLGFALGQPILLSFVETGSMEPTLDPGDGFVALPTEVSGEIESGDVVVFEAQELQGGGLTTHRVVGETEAGYITQGDANPFPDQDGDEPPVQDAQIVATALQVNGEAVTIPRVGAAIIAFQSMLETVQEELAVALGARWLLGTGGVATVLFGLSLLAWFVDWYLEDASNPDRPKEPDRGREEGVSLRTILIGFTMLIIIAATATMVIPSGPQEYALVSAEFESEDPAVIQQGTSQSHEYTVRNDGIVPMQTYVEPDSDRVTVDPEQIYVEQLSDRSVTVTLSAPESTGYYPTYVQERRYLAVLPTTVIDWLYEIHPWLPIVAINTVLGGSFYFLGLLVAGSGRRRLRPKQTPVNRSLTNRLRSRLYNR